MREGGDLLVCGGGREEGEAGKGTLHITVMNMVEKLMVSRYKMSAALWEREREREGGGGRENLFQVP